MDGANVTAGDPHELGAPSGHPDGYQESGLMTRALEHSPMAVLAEPADLEQLEVALRRTLGVEKALGQL